MKFITNRISTGKSGSFGDFVQKLAASNAALNKTASTEAVTKEANIANFGDKKANPFGAKKEDAPKGEAKKDDKKDDKKEGEEKDACGSSCEASTEKEVKVAEEGKASKKDNKVDDKGEMHVHKQFVPQARSPEHSHDEKDLYDTDAGTAKGEVAIGPKGGKIANAKPATKKADNSDIPPENKGVTHKMDECCGAPKSKTDDGSEGSKKSAPKGESKKEEPKEEKKEASARRLVRIANLDSKTKNEWKKYWKNLYPTEYVDAMFADK